MENKFCAPVVQAPHWARPGFVLSLSSNRFESPKDALSLACSFVCKTKSFRREAKEILCKPISLGSKLNQPKSDSANRRPLSSCATKSLCSGPLPAHGNMMEWIPTRAAGPFLAALGQQANKSAPTNERRGEPVQFGARGGGGGGGEGKLGLGHSINLRRVLLLSGGGGSLDPQLSLDLPAFAQSVRRAARLASLESRSLRSEIKT